MFFAVFVGFDKLAALSQKSPSPAPDSARFLSDFVTINTGFTSCIFTEYLHIIFRPLQFDLPWRSAALIDNFGTADSLLKCAIAYISIIFKSSARFFCICLIAKLLFFLIFSPSLSISALKPISAYLCTHIQGRKRPQEQAPAARDYSVTDCASGVIRQQR